MKTFTIGMTPALEISLGIDRLDLPDDFLEIGCHTTSEDFEVLKQCVEMGIDSYLEAFTVSKFEGRDEFGRQMFYFHRSEIHTLLRRLMELWEDSGEDATLTMRQDILGLMDIEEV